MCDLRLETDLVALVQVSAASGGICLRNAKQDLFAPGALDSWAPDSTHLDGTLWQRLSKMCGQSCLSTFYSSLQGGTGDFPRCASGSHMSANGLFNAEQAPTGATAEPLVLLEAGR